jgi:methyltransferase
LPSVIVVIAIVFVPMLIEAWHAAANERVQRARGGVEASGDVYGIMRIAYPSAFLSMLVEQVLRGGAQQTGTFGAGLIAFVGAKALKWWAIRTLGRSWTFRVIVVPDAPLVIGGPYRFLRHPNYVAVVGELIAVSLMTQAWIAGPVAVVGFGLLILKRIAVEERALRLPSS